MTKTAKPPTTPTCFNCVYGHWDPNEAFWSISVGWFSRPSCANHPDSPGQMRQTPSQVCRNYRRKPPKPGGDAKQIPLGDGCYAYVDAADFEWLNRYNWRLQNGYAARRQNGRVIYMHREIMNPPKGMMVDHGNHNKLDNTRENLRVCTRQQNTHNNRKHVDSCSQFKGVGYNREKEKWFAKAYFEGKRIWLGYFDEEADAARAYDRTAVEYFGEFAHLNFPEEWPPERRAQVRAQREAATPRTEDSGQRTAKRGRPRATSDKGRATKRSKKSRRATGHKPRATTPKGKKTSTRAQTPGRRVRKPRAKPPVRKQQKRPKAGKTRPNHQ